MSEGPNKPQKHWKVDAPTTGPGYAILAAGLGMALRETVAQLRKTAPDAMEEARAAATLAIKTAIAEGVAIEDEAIGWKAALETTSAMFEAEMWNLGGDDES